MRRILFTMVPPWRLRLALALWIGLEIGAFVLVVRWIGPGGAVLAGLATSLLGVSQLKRAGRAAIAKLRGGLGGRSAGGPATGPLFDETLGTLGGLCLLVPGFLSDIVGVALAIPALRGWLSRRVGRWIGRRPGAGPAGQGRPHAPAAIDLDPVEWRHTDERRADWRNPERTKPIPPP